MDAHYSQLIRPILDCFDKIKENLLGSSEGIEIPEIVVVGIQSSGKSSVLESISNIQLPRGENTVTKCPIVLQLRNTTSNDEYALIRFEGQTEEGAKRIQLGEISTYLEKYQEELLLQCESKISEKGIYIKIYRRNSPDLTLKDLPGLYYQDKAIEELLKSMYFEYTKSSQSIILLVLPATSDLVTSPAIAIIRDHPNFQNRTIPVVTKIDLKQNEPKFFETLTKNELNLKHLPIVVRNRTQKEIDDHESIDTIRKKEQELIQSIVELKNLPESSKGIDQLVNLLLQIQKSTLLDARLTIKDKIIFRLDELKEEYQKLPKKIVTLQDKNNAFIACCDVLYENYKTKIGGFTTGKSLERQMKEKMRNICEAFEKDLDYFCSEEMYKFVNTTIQNSIGLKLENLTDSNGFYSIMTKEITQSFSQCFPFIRIIKNLILDPIPDLCKEAFANYPLFINYIRSELDSAMEKQLEKAKAFITELSRLDYTIFTLNKLYISIVKNLTAFCQAQLSNFKTHGYFNTSQEFNLNNIVSVSEETIAKALIIFQSKTEYDLELTMILSMYAYWTVFSRRFADYFLLCIQNYLYKFFMDNFKNILQSLSPGLNLKTQGWIEENPSIELNRQNLNKRITALQESFETLNNLF